MSENPETVQDLDRIHDNPTTFQRICAYLLSPQESDGNQ